MKQEWSCEERPQLGQGEWVGWITRTLNRIKTFCQSIGRDKACENKEQAKQLRSIVVVAQTLLESHPKCTIAQESLEAASQELLEKERQKIEWETIRASACWAQLEGRMDSVFFEGVRESHSTILVQLFIGPDGKVYSTNEELASYANSYYMDHFTSDGMISECKAARNCYWNNVPSRVTERMNEQLTRRLQLEGVQQTFKAL